MIVDNQVKNHHHSISIEAVLKPSNLSAEPLMATSWFLSFLYRQLFIMPSYPTQDFTSQTIIVTGSNTGLGLEAARHLVRLNAARVILAVRTLSKGEAAKASIEASTGRKGVVEVWQLDMASYDSVREFAKRAQGLDRLDCVLENAGILTQKFVKVGEDESILTVNTVNTLLLGLLLLPKLRETARRWNVLPRISIVVSDMHFIAKFPERKAESVFCALNDETKTDMGDR